MLPGPVAASRTGGGTFSFLRQIPAFPSGSFKLPKTSFMGGFEDCIGVIPLQPHHATIFLQKSWKLIIIIQLVVIALDVLINVSAIYFKRLMVVLWLYTGRELWKPVLSLAVQSL